MTGNAVLTHVGRLFHSGGYSPRAEGPGVVLVRRNSPPAGYGPAEAGHYDGPVDLIPGARLQKPLGRRVRLQPDRMGTYDIVGRVA